jgi:ATP-dependent Lhr-like helicase
VEERLERLRGQFPWVQTGATAVVEEAPGLTRWWTFGGMLANAAIAPYLRRRGLNIGSVDNLGINLESPGDLPRLRTVLAGTSANDIAAMRSPVSEETVDKLKFSVCLPRDLAVRMLETRLTDHEAVRRVLCEPVHSVSSSD